MQQYTGVLSLSLGLPMLALRSNWHFLPAIHWKQLSTSPLPPHLQASQDLGLTRLWWRGCCWLPVLAASPPFFQLCFETQSKFKKKKIKNWMFLLSPLTSALPQSLAACRLAYMAQTFGIETLTCRESMNFGKEGEVRDRNEGEGPRGLWEVSHFNGRGREKRKMAL